MLCILTNVNLLFIKRDFFIYMLLMGEEGEKERERKINVWLPLTHPQLGTWPANQVWALSGNQTSNPLVL